MRKLVPVVLLLTVALAGVVLRGQQTPAQSLAALKPAPGLELKLWAAEPMLTNPTDIAVDERGRVWVLEGANYRRTQRNLPDVRPAGDRIVILEDTDQDGKADKVKVFDQNPQIRVPLGIAVLGDKVYISQAPDLIVYTKDADDKILSREVLLTGFAGIDHDHGLHAVVFGPDGKYYFNQGNTGFDLTDRSGTHLQTQGTGANTRPGPGYYEGAVLRMNGDGTGVEVIGQNFRNPYEVAVDSFDILTSFVLENGASVQGLVTEDAADRIIVQTAADQSRRLKPSDVASRRQIRVSLMPEGLLSALSLQQVADLLEFLSTLR